jgi:integrase
LIATPSNTGCKWSLRYVSPVTGKRREAGAGTYPLVTLTEARERALAMRKLIDEGKDPIEERKREDNAAAHASNVPTFGEAAKKVHTDLKAGWKETKNVARWLASIELHLAAVADRRVDTLTPADFAEALRAEWVEHPRAAADVLQRASVIMRWCFAKGHVSGDPTALVRSLLPRQDTRVEHHPALPWKKAPAFVREHLADIGPTEVIRACAFVQMHTACRPNEARGMQWGELDLEAAVWVVPAARMKGKLDHRVPLAPDAVALLRRLAAAKLHPVFVFPNTLNTAPIADVRLQEFMQERKAPSDTAGRFATPHGCRSMFMNWAVDTGHDERTADRQLAHRPKGQVAQAYERSSQFERRAHLVADWADYLHGRVKTNVVPFASAAA